MNYYDFHIGDYTSRTAHLEPLEDLAYRRLLDLYYLREQPLPHDADRVATLIRMRGQGDLVLSVLEEFFQCDSELGWVHAKCEEVIAKAHAAAERARTNGKRGGRPSATQSEPTAFEGKNPEETQSVISGNPEKSKSQAPTSHFPLPTSQEEEGREPRKRVSAPCPSGVDATVWADYLAVRKAKKAGPVTETVLTGLRREAAKARIGLPDAVRACCEYGWQGFSAEWYANRVAKAAVSQARGEPAWRTEQRQRTAIAAPGVADMPAADFFDVEARPVAPRLGVSQ